MVDSGLALQGAPIQSLVRELGFHMPLSVVKQKQTEIVMTNKKGLKTNANSELLFPLGTG